MSALSFGNRANVVNAAPPYASKCDDKDNVIEEGKKKKKKTILRGSVYVAREGRFRYVAQCASATIGEKEYPKKNGRMRYSHARSGRVRVKRRLLLRALLRSRLRFRRAIHVYRYYGYIFVPTLKIQFLYVSKMTPVQRSNCLCFKVTNSYHVFSRISCL